MRKDKQLRDEPDEGVACVTCRKKRKAGEPRWVSKRLYGDNEDTWACSKDCAACFDKVVIFGCC